MSDYLKELFINEVKPALKRYSGSGGGDNTNLLESLIDRSITEVSSNVTNIPRYMFYRCTALTVANFPAATSIDMNAFDSCTSLTTINFPVVTYISSNVFINCGFDTADFPFVKGQILTGSFGNNPNLKEINFPLVTEIGYNAFGNCTALEKVVFPSVTFVNGFRGCKNLIEADFPVAEKVSGYFSFCGSGIERLILRNTNVMAPLDDGTAFHYINETTPIHKGTGYIYVPKALIEDYKAATNWSVYALQFRALEDYTVDGTTTGALDETKI
jgi:hypothetical protein